MLPHAPEALRLRTTRPLLSWPPLSGAAVYVMVSLGSAAAAIGMALQVLA